jgi:hypothetical protein
VPQLNPTNQHDRTHRRPWLLVVAICLCVLAAITHAAESDPTPSRSFKEMLDVSHDELIMLIVSLAVVIEVVANFGFVRRIPQRFLFLCSFGSFVLGAFLTVIEGLIFAGALNYLEHLAYMAGAISLAVWCGRVFGSKKQECP